MYTNKMVKSGPLHFTRIGPQSFGRIIIIVKIGNNPLAFLILLTNQVTSKRVESLVNLKVIMISCGGYHAAACTKDDFMYTFGRGVHGQLGHVDKDKLLQH